MPNIPARGRLDFNFAEYPLLHFITVNESPEGLKVLKALKSPIEIKGLKCLIVLKYLQHFIVFQGLKVFIEPISPKFLIDNKGCKSCIEIKGGIRLILLK